MGTISHLEPTRVFTYFEEMCQIPHGSGNVQKISDYFEFEILNPSNDNTVTQ